MPSRRHKSSPSPAAPWEASNRPAAPAASSTGRDPAEMFAAAVRESEARDKVQRDVERQRREDAERKAAAAKADQVALAEAKRDLDRAIAAVRDAKANGRGRAEADARWKAAKARVIELETGAAPTWAPPPPVVEEPAEEVAGDSTESAEESAE